jgi:hypothetical protein
VNPEPSAAGRINKIHSPHRVLKPQILPRSVHLGPLQGSKPAFSPILTFFHCGVLKLSWTSPYVLLPVPTNTLDFFIESLILFPV